MTWTWYTWLILASIVVAVAAITGVKPSGTRHVAHTSMMGIARIVLVVMGVIILIAVFLARSGG